MINKALAIIQARCSSKRLPNKVLENICGMPMIWHIVQRAESCKFVNKVVVATSSDATDDQLFEFCKKNEINVFRGSLSNVLSRFIAILKKSKNKYFVRITGDCPLIYPEFIDAQIKALNDFDADFIQICSNSTVLEGQGVRSTSSLFHLNDRTQHLDDLEHVGSRYLNENVNFYKVLKFVIPHKLRGSKYKITVDEKLDLDLIRKLYNDLYSGPPISLLDALGWLEDNPHISMINQTVSNSKINIQLNKKVNAGINFYGTVKW